MTLRLISSSSPSYTCGVLVKRLIYILALLSASSSLYGCLKCYAMGCSYQARIDILDTEGDAVPVFSGTAEVDGKRYAFICENDSPGIITELEGFEPIDFCLSGAVYIPFPEGEQPDITLVVESGEGERFEGTISPQYVVDDAFNGKGCGSCTFGSASVTLDEP